MNLINMLRIWLRERKQIREQRTFQKGYNYAMNSLRTGKETPESLYEFTDAAEAFCTLDQFDHGMRQAIYDFELQAVEDKCGQ